ncbi:sulfatase-like hydrolase/transferase [Paenibacillus thalictri]|uniref:sulfatase-like hydrolase/transferase n=1 Tax=Paenibacillus thalictri TaxID=2527873 RepID=UPI001F0DE463|nr:sulfatase-like hydrolase/transferase [Paenibacillus thalictri]
MKSNVVRPNILWISLEDTSPRFGCYGDPLARTPHIDNLAAEGTIYPNAFSTAGVCSPSRSAIITGMYPTSIGAQHMRTEHVNKHTPELPTPYYAVPPAYVKTFTEYLRADGYFCTNNFKTDYQFPSPLTAWDEDGKQAHWRHREPGQPFFAVFNHLLTHESSMWGDMIRNHYSPDTVLPAVTDPEQIDDHWRFLAKSNEIGTAVRPEQYKSGGMHAKLRRRKLYAIAGDRALVFQLAKSFR